MGFRSDKPGGLSHCFLAFDPSVCVPQHGVEDGDPKNFSERMQELMDTFRIGSLNFYTATEHMTQIELVKKNLIMSIIY